MLRIFVKVLVVSLLSLPMALTCAAKSNGDSIMVPTEEPRPLVDALPPPEDGAVNERTKLQKAQQSQQQMENSGEKHFGAPRGVSNRDGE